MKKKPAGWIKWVVVAAIAALVAAFCRVTIVWDDLSATAGGASLTVAEQYCQDNWESRMVPTIKEKAVEAVAVFGAAKANLNAAGEKYGARENQTSAWNFCVKGTASVIDLENAQKASKTRLIIDLDPEDGVADAQIQWSSVIKTNALRDSVGFLHLDDFANQVEFAELTKAFNARIQKDLIKKTDASALLKKKISFVGCVALASSAEPSDIEIIPVELSEVG